MGSEWIEITLDEAYEFKSGLSKSRDQFGSGYGFVSFKDVFYNYFLPEKLEGLVNTNKKEQVSCSVKRGDVFLTRTSETFDELGMSSVALKDYDQATFNGFTKRLRPKGNYQILPEFIGYYFRSQFFRRLVTSMATMTTRASLNNEILSKLIVKFPSLQEQKSIAHILGTLDDKIELNRKMNETLEAMAQTLFKSWFVDFDPVLDKALAAGHEIPKPLQENAEKRKALGSKRKALPQEIADLFPDRFVFTEELGWVPEGWEISNIGNEFNVTMGQSPPGSTYNENSEGIRFFQGKADFGFRYPTDRIYCSEPKRFASEGDTLMSVRAPVGDVNIALHDCSIGRGLCAIRHKLSSKSYTYYFMKHKKAILDSYESGGTVFGSINQKQLKSLDAFGNIESIISAFHDIASSHDEKIELNSRELLILSQTRNTLLPKLISGELRVPEAQKMLANNF
ncbi:restriction endonuclease subunit S [Marivirga sp.]|uniref:restriction endonuclease subunit S n=1 Tax=Marivirga sp. TaxID=2018662 RepID=UPI0025CF5DCB|nr:restriction endonuclease subunit S [Marivirga sp.]